MTEPARGIIGEPANTNSIGPPADSEGSAEPTTYMPDDRTMLGPSPWNPDALIAWEKAHGHDVRLSCDHNDCCPVLREAERDQVREQVVADAVPVVAKALAFAAEEVRQSLHVRYEFRDNSPDEVWDRITEFQREQYLGRSRIILDSVARGDGTPPGYRPVTQHPSRPSGASTEPTREAVWIRVESSPDLLGIVRAREIQNDIQRLIDRNWGSGVTVAIAVRDGAASTEATPQDACPRCAHRPHRAGECQARYYVTATALDPGEPCYCTVSTPVRASTEATERPDLRAALDAAEQHAECGKPTYTGCYSHFSGPHCRADGLPWPCDVENIRAALTGATSPSEPQEKS